MHTICIPGLPPVDGSAFGRVIDHELFQRLRERKQLGLNAIVFPGAVHTRMEHALGVLSLTQRFCQLHPVPQEAALRMQLFALLHDIGHGPFSHQVEPVLPGNHHENGLRLLEQMELLLRDCYGITLEELRDFYSEKECWARYVSDRNLGTDKLDYLSRDALHIGFHGTPDIRQIQCATVLTAEGPAIEEKFLEDGKMLQKFYSYLHQHGYLNKTALSAQRMLQRAMQELLLLKDCPSAERIWEMGDEELMLLLRTCGSPLAVRLANALRNRCLHKSFLVLKPTGYGYVERQAGKPICILERPRSELRAFCEKVQDLEKLRELEDRIAALCGLAPGEILFAAMPYFKKLLPRDLRVFASNHPDETYSLFEKDADHRRTLESDYLRTFAVRLVSPEVHRAKLAKNADAILSELLCSP